MASTDERSSSRSSATLMPGRIVVAYDATKNLNAEELKQIIGNIRLRKSMIQEVDTITVLGVMHKVLHPMGFRIQIGPDSLIGTRIRAIKEEVSRIVDAYIRKLQHNAQECDDSGVVIEVKIVVGAPLKEVVAQEAVASNATWVVLNRNLKKELRFYLKHIPCKVALTLDNFSLKVLRPSYSDKATATIEHQLFYSLTKLVPPTPAEHNPSNNQSTSSPIYRESTSSRGSFCSDKSSFASSLTSNSKEQSIFSPEFVSNTNSQEKSVMCVNGKDKNGGCPPVKVKQSGERDPSLSVPCITAQEINSKLAENETNYLETDTNVKVDAESDDSHLKIQKQRDLQLDFMRQRLKEWNHSEIQTATNDFSSGNLLREDEYGLVYKGQLEDGQLISVRVQKEANFKDFRSQLRVLSVACHKNVVMLLGYCCGENTNILVYEYIRNGSLEWHLFDNLERVLEWRQRHAIAIGIAKGLRFLHEECRGSPVLYRNMRPSNIYLTHEFIPLLADCSLTKWKTNEHDIKTRFQETSEYIAPEYAENGTCSIKTDVFAFGIIMLQLISGRRGVDSVKDSHPQSLREWAMPLIETLKLDELVDPRIGDSYAMYEVYQMAKVASLCIQTRSDMRPTVREVLLILEGENNLVDQLTQQIIHVPNNL